MKKDMKFKKTAIFDLDGTLVETDAANDAAYRTALNRLDVGKIDGFYGRISSDVVRTAMDLSSEEMEAVVRAKIRVYCQELWRTRLGPASDMFRCVLVHRSAFDKVVLLTDSSEQRAKETLARFDLARHFDEIVCNGGRGDKFANYFGEFDSDPATCVVWENEEGQVKSAIAAGVKMKNIRRVR